MSAEIGLKLSDNLWLNHFEKSISCCSTSREDDVGVEIEALKQDPLQEEVEGILVIHLLFFSLCSKLTKNIFKC